MFKIGHAQHGVVVPRGVRLPKTPANELKLNLFEFLQRVQQRFNKVKGNKISQLFCLQNDRDNHWVIVTQSVGYDCNATVIGSMRVARRANINNKQFTTASTFHYVGAVALYIHPPECSGGILIKKLINVIWHHFLTPVAYIVYRLNSGRESYIANDGKLGRKKGSINSRVSEHTNIYICILRAKVNS